MTKTSELYREARRCADQASRGVSPKMFHGFEKFYAALAQSEPEGAQPRQAPRQTARPDEPLITAVQGRG